MLSENTFDLRLFNISFSNLIDNIVFVDFSSCEIRTNVDECGQTARCNAFQALQRRCWRIRNQFHKSGIVRILL